MYHVKVKDKRGNESVIHVADASMTTPADAAAHVKRSFPDSEIVSAEVAQPKKWSQRKPARVITPGSILGVDHPFAWYAIVEHKTTKKRWTIMINGLNLDRESVAGWVATHLRNADLITAGRCTEQADADADSDSPQDLYDLRDSRFQIEKELARP